MNQIEFNRLFGSEEKCIEHYKNLRIKRGVTCRKCHSKSHYWSKFHKSFICKNRQCGCRTTLRSGTIMMHSNFTIKRWYEIIFEISKIGDDKPTTQIQRAIGAKRYESIWYTVQKIRKHMGELNDDFQFEAFHILVPRKNNLSKNHSNIPSGTLLSDNGREIRLIYEKHDNHVKFKSYRCPKIVDIPIGKPDKVIDVRPLKNIFGYEIFRELVYKIKRIHRNVSDYFIQLYLEQFCFLKNHRKKENLFEYLLESGV